MEKQRSEIKDYLVDTKESLKESVASIISKSKNSFKENQMAKVKEEHFGIARKIVSNMTSESWETIPTLL